MDAENHFDNGWIGGDASEILAMHKVACVVHPSEQQR